MPGHFSFRPRHALCVFGIALCVPAHAGGIDHEVTYDNSGIWNRKYQLLLVDTMILGTIGGAMWEGGETRLGRTLWQGTDSLLLGAVSSETLKQIVQRPRPTQTTGNDSDEVEQGKGHYSFPSGEVTAVAAAITPFVLEYGHENPWAYALEILPLYDSIARVKSQAHWQTDVIAGWALGSATGYYAHSRDNSFSLSIMPHSVYVGFKKKF